MTKPILGGKPLKFETVEELDRQLANYFAITPEDEWTWTGLALALDTDKWTLHNYIHRDEYSASIRRAMLKIEGGYEKDLKKHWRTGTIFALKNFDWKDKSEVESTVKQYNFEHLSDEDLLKLSRGQQIDTPTE